MLTLNDSVVRDNVADEGGGIDNEVGFDGVLTISGSTISGNRSNEGGGIYNGSRGPEPQTGTDPPGMTITGSTIELNIANFDTGGGIYNDGEAVITGSTVRANETSGTLGGGGIFNGGAEQRPAELELIGSLVSNNLVSNGYGGGISNEPCSLLDVLDTTISGNTAIEGGGIYNDFSEIFGDLPTIPTVDLDHVTLTGNTILDGTGAGIYNAQGVSSEPTPSIVRLRTTILSASTGDDLPDETVLQAQTMTAAGRTPSPRGATSRMRTPVV